MSLELNAKKTALVCLDFQNDIVHENAPLAQAMGTAQMVKQHQVLEKAARVQDAARSAGMSVIHVNVEFDEKSPAPPHRGMFFKMLSQGQPSLVKGTWGAEFHPVTAPKSGDVIVTKRMISGFYGSGLKEVLDQKGITDIVLIGVATPFAVEGTVWSAVEMGFSCVVLKDGCCAGNADMHESSINTSLTFLADIGTCDDFMKAVRA